MWRLCPKYTRTDIYLLPRLVQTLMRGNTTHTQQSRGTVTRDSHTNARTHTHLLCRPSLLRVLLEQFLDEILSRVAHVPPRLLLKRHLAANAVRSSFFFLRPATKTEQHTMPLLGTGRTWARLGGCEARLDWWKVWAGPPPRKKAAGQRAAGGARNVGATLASLSSRPQTQPSIVSLCTGASLPQANRAWPTPGLYAPFFPFDATPHPNKSPKGDGRIGRSGAGRGGHMLSSPGPLFFKCASVCSSIWVNCGAAKSLKGQSTPRIRPTT